MKHAEEMTSGEIPALIKKMAIPASIGFFFQTMYNVVDTYWAGVLSTEAQAALALSFPIFFIVIAMGSGVGTAANVLISHSLGAKDPKSAVKYAAQSLSFAIIVSIFLTIAGLAISPWLFTLLGASASYLQTSTDYMNVLLLGTVFFMLSFLMNSFLNTHGDTKSFRNALITGFFLNVVFDPLLMLGFGPVPPMGVAGLAWATVLIQILTAIYLGYKVMRLGLFFGLSSKDFLPEGKSFFEITKQGFPASINMMTVAIGIFIITYFISKYGQGAVAAYGIATRIEQIILLPTIGLNIAVLTLVGHNTGAKEYARVRQVYYIALKYAVLLVTIGAVVVFAFPDALMGLFTQDKEVVSIAVPYLRIAAFNFWAYAALFLTVSLLQGVKRPMFAVWIGLYRQIAAPIVVFWFLSEFLAWGIGGIWWGIFFVLWSATAITILYANSTLKKLHLFG